MSLFLLFFAEFEFVFRIAILLVFTGSGRDVDKSFWSWTWIRINFRAVRPNTGLVQSGQRKVDNAEKMRNYNIYSLNVSNITDQKYNRRTKLLFLKNEKIKIEICCESLKVLFFTCLSKLETFFFSQMAFWLRRIRFCPRHRPSAWQASFCSNSFRSKRSLRFQKSCAPEM